MKRVLLDTNIYGLIVKDNDRAKIRNKIEKERAVVVYGLPLIRRELRSTPKNIRIDGINLRNDLLVLYDKLTENHLLKFLNEAEELAESYFYIYKEIGGFASRDEIVKDFCIIAYASLNSLDIVVSDDSRTMFSEKATKSYSIANQIKKIRLPRFVNYEEFKRELKL